MFGQCFNCNTYQVVQQTKSKKWACKICHHKQSVLKIYAQRDSAKDVRPIVQERNLKRGELEERAAPEEYSGQVSEQLVGTFVTPSVNEWDVLFGESSESEVEDISGTQLFHTNAHDHYARGAKRNATQRDASNEEYTTKARPSKQSKIERMSHARPNALSEPGLSSQSILKRLGGARDTKNPVEEHSALSRNVFLRSVGDVAPPAAPKRTTLLSGDRILGSNLPKSYEGEAKPVPSAPTQNAWSEFLDDDSDSYSGGDGLFAVN